MTWTSVNASSAEACGLMPDEYDAIIAAVDSEATPGLTVLTRCASQLCAHIQGALAAGGAMPLGPEDTLPPGVLRSFTALLRRDVVACIPQLGETLMKGDRRQLALEAEAHLKRLETNAKGYSYSPDEPAAEQPNSQAGGELITGLNTTLRSRTRRVLG